MQSKLNRCYAVRGHDSGHQFGTNPKHVPDFLLMINTYILSYSISKLLQIRPIGHISL